MTGMLIYNYVRMISTYHVYTQALYWFLKISSHRYHPVSLFANERSNSSNLQPLPSVCMGVGTGVARGARASLVFELAYTSE